MCRGSIAAAEMGAKKNTGKRKAVFLEGNGKGAPHKNEPKSTFPSWWFQPR